LEESLPGTNMKIRVITTWNEKLFQEYAHRFELSFKRHWNFPLTVYNEDKDFFDLVPECKEFIERNKHRLHKDFLRDACRFSYKVYAYTHAVINDTESDFIMGIDADSVFYKTINKIWIKENIWHSDRMLTYLGRGSQYSECGFLGFNMQHAETKNFARAMKEMYDKDKLFNLIEWHDSYIWDHVRKEFEAKGINNYNIGDGGNGHVQARSCLGPIYDHTKGSRRKIEGFSGENTILSNKKGKYE
jgi:hypothetical protein